MSTVVENRVVQMDFDNSKFLSGIKSSISGLKDMTETMAAVNGKSGLQNLASGMVDIGKNVSSLSDKFSTWGIVAKTVIENLTDRVVNGLLAGLQKVDNFFQLSEITTGSISSGWSKYAEKSEAVATIMSATGKDVEYVSEQMERLNWFTDETSYNFTDMASNIGKFTANQIPLENAVTQMEGIATWAAISGQNASSASRAMYNMAQAIGVGSVKLMDWKSIENANMATSDFKNNVIKTAEAMGVLKLKTEDAENELNNIYEIVGSGKEVSVKNFNENLSEGWFSSDVLQGVLEKYGNFSQSVNDLYNMYQAAGKNVLTADIVKEGGLIDQYASADAAGKLKMIDEIVKETGADAEWLTAKFDDLSSAENDIGREAFSAAQEARTFAAAIDATKDAASTLWMNIYEKLFGNVEEATVIWSDFCQFLYEAFVEPLWDIYDEVSDFVDAGGMKELLNGLGNLGEGFLAVSEVVRENFTGVLSSALIKAGQSINKFGIRFKNIIDILNTSSSDGGASPLQKLIDGFKDIWSAVKSITNPIKKAFETIFPKKTFTDTAELLSKVIDKFKSFTETLALNEDQSKKVQHIFETLFEIIKKIGTAILSLTKYLKPLWDAFCDLGDALLTAVDGVVGFYDGLNKGTDETPLLQKIIEGISTAIGWLSDKIRSFSLSETWQNIKTFFTNAWNFVKKIAGKIKEALGDINIPALLFGTGAAAAGIGVGKIGKSVGGLADVFSKISDAIKDPSKLFGKLSEGIGGFVDTIKEKLGGGGDKTNIVGLLKDLAIAIAILSASMLVLSLIDIGSAAKALAIIAGLMLGLLVVVSELSTITGSMKTAKIVALGVSMVFIASAMLILAASLVVIAAALGIFTLIAKDDSALVGLALMASSLILLAAALGVLSTVCNPVSLVATAAAMLVMAAAMLVLAVAVAAFVAIAKIAGDQAVIDGLLAMVAAVASVAVVLALLSTYCNPVTLLASAAAMLVMAAAITVLSVAFALFVATMALGGDSAMDALISMVVIIAVVAASLAILSGFGPMVIVAAAAVLVFAVAAGILSAAFLVVVVAIDLLIAGLYLLGPALASIGDGIESMSISISEGFKKALENLGEGIGGFIGGIFEGIAKAIAEGLDAVSESLTDFGTSVEGLGTNIERFGDGLKSLKDVPWTSIAIGLVEIAGGFNKLIDDAKGLDDTVDEIFGLESALSKVSSIATTFSSKGSLIVEKLAYGIKKSSHLVTNATTSMVNSATSVVRSVNSEWYNLGSYAAQGYANGIYVWTSYVAARAYNMVINAKNAAIRAQNSHSPSKVFMKLGSYAGEGYALGIDSEKKMVAESAAGMISSAIDAIDSEFDTDMQPTIRPVLDTSEVQKGMSAISGMLDSSKTYSLGANLASTIRNGQNGGTSDTKQSVSLDQDSISAIRNQKIDVNNTVTFEGNLAQLGAVLQPVIKSEANRRGINLIQTVR